MASHVPSDLLGPNFTSMHCSQGEHVSELGHIVSKLAPRWFVVRNAQATDGGPVLIRPRDTWSMMRGPLMRNELREVPTWLQGTDEGEEAAK